MSLEDIVTINLTVDSSPIERAGFGVPLILAGDATYTPELVRFYSSQTAMAADFASTTGTYKMAAKVFAQNPKLPKLAVGRLTTPPTQRWAITPTAVNSFTYQIRVNGTLLSFTSDSSATVTEIIAGLKTAIDGLSLGLTTSDQTSFLRVLANTAGAFFSLEVVSTNLKIAQDQAEPSPTLATQLDAIELENGTWYALLNPMNSSACAAAIAAWAETNKKLFICQTQDSDVANLSNSADTGGSKTIAGILRDATDFRTALIYHTATDAFADAGWAGAVLTTDPGSETWAFKTLASVAVTNINDTQKTNILAKHANVYITTAGINHTLEGTVSGNEFIDVIRFRDWLEATMAEDIFSAVSKAVKIPFTDSGIATIQGIIEARLKLAVQVGGLSSDPAPRVTVPLAKDVSSGDKAARKLTGVKFDAVLAGAIQAITITGLVTV